MAFLVLEELDEAMRLAGADHCLCRDAGLAQLPRAANAFVLQRVELTRLYQGKAKAA